MPSLKKLAIQGTIWTLAGYGGSQLLRLGGNVILTRLLVPELFGLMALVNTFITGLNLFSDIGIRPSIIRSPRGSDPLFLNTAWTLQVMRGFGLWLACGVIAWPIARFYGDNQFLWLLPAMGLTTMIAGFNSTALATLNRKLEIGKLIRLDISVQTISLSVMIVWAYFQKTVWALIGGNLISSFCQMVWSHRLDPGLSNRFAWDKSALQELIGFGRWIFLSTSMNFLAGQADRLILGKLFSLEMLGVYTIAFTLSDLPTQILQKINTRIVFPVISQHIHLPRPELRAKILKKRSQLFLMVALPSSFLVGFGDLLVLGLYDNRYADASWMLPLLALGTWPGLIALLTGPALLAIGQPRYLTYGTFFRFILLLVGLPLGFAWGGTTTCVVVTAFSHFPYYLATVYGLWQEQLGSFKRDIIDTGLFLGLILLIFIVRELLGWGLPGFLPIRF